MNLRNYITGISLSLFCAATTFPSWACGACDDAIFINPFTLIEPLQVSYQGGSMEALKETTSFWHNYTKGAVSEEMVLDYFNHASVVDLTPIGHSKLIQYLQKNFNDKAIQYICDCLYFNKLSREYEDSGWSYSERDPHDLLVFSNVIDGRNGGEIFSQRYLLLKMRIAGLLRDDKTVMDIWKSSGENMTSCALRDRMGGFVGGVLYRQGKYIEALDYFCKSGDRNSVEWCLSKLIGLPNLRKLYAHNPNSNATKYALNDYLNYIVSGSNLPSDVDDPESYKRILKDVMSTKDEFIALCDEAINDNRIDDQIAWAIAKGITELMSGKQGLATIKQAKDLKGTAKSRNTLENVELWALLLNTGKGIEEVDLQFIECLDKKYQMVSKECLPELNNKKNNEEISSMENYDFLTTFFLTEANKHFTKIGKPASALGILAMLAQLPMSSYNSQQQFREYIFRTLSNTDALSIMQIINHGGNNTLDKFFAPYLSNCKNLANEAYGTRLLVNNDFEGALNYLNDVDLNWISNQAIYPYLNRYAAPSYYPFKRVRTNSETRSNYNPKNIKANFCRDIIARQNNYNTLSGNDKAQAAFDVAVLLHLASAAGDCWAISDYQWSSGMQANKFNTEAGKWLQKAWATATDPTLKCKIGYAILANPDFDTEGNARFAFGHTGGYYEPTRYYWDNRTDLNNLAMTYLINHYDIAMDDYEMGHCDILKDYISYRFIEKPTYYY